MASDEVVVLGAGVTGLAAGVASGGTVLEAAAGPGGICSSYYLRPGSDERLDRRPADGDAYRFEVGGGHWIFGGPPEALRLVEELAPTGRHRRRAVVHLPREEAWVPYPLQEHAAAVAPQLMAPVRPDPSDEGWEGGTLAAWLVEQFGPELCARFFLPFHDRYTAGLHRHVAPQDTYKSPTRGRGYNPTFRYPLAGLDTLARGMADRTDVRYGAKVVTIDPVSRSVGLADGREVGYRHLISTLALPDALALAGRSVHGPPDPATSVLVVNIGAIRGDRTPDAHWVYAPQLAGGFHRYGIYTNVDASFAPGGATDRVGLYVERSTRRGERPEPDVEEADVEALVRDLQETGVIGEVEVLDVSWVEVAYTWRWPGSTWAADALESLEEVGIHQVGRYARWHFQGIGDSLAEGLAAGAGAWR